MRVLVITQEEPFFLPGFFKRMFEARKESIAGVVALSPASFRRKWFSMLKRLFNLYGFWGFVREGMLFTWFKFLNFISRFVRFRRFYSVAATARHYSIDFIEETDINSSAFLDKVREMDIDLMLSVSATQIFRRKLLDIPRLGCINLHTSPLPRYRGLMPCFWALANGESQTAVTVHRMDTKLDNGDIILQREIDIYPEDTLYSLIARTKSLGVELLLEAMDQIENGTVCPRINDDSNATYFGFPTREDARKFRKMGRRFR